MVELPALDLGSTAVDLGSTVNRCMVIVYSPCLLAWRLFLGALASSASVNVVLYC